MQKQTEEDKEVTEVYARARVNERLLGTAGKVEAPEEGEVVAGMADDAAGGKMDEEGEDNADSGRTDVLARARLDLEEAAARVGRAFSPTLEVILSGRDNIDRQTIEMEVGKLGQAPCVFSSDKIFISGFYIVNFTNDYEKLVAECKHLLVEYGVTCDVSNITPEILWPEV